jgi:hypothetical protein
VHVQHELESAYPGGVNTIDAFEGGLAEAHVAGSDVGPLFQAIIANQFTRLRDGDRFFFQNETFTREEIRILRSGNTLTKVIEANTPVSNLQSDAMVFKASISGTVKNASTWSMPGHTMDWAYDNSGVTMLLEDQDGDVLASTKTDRNGHYVFTQLSGLAANLSVGSGVSATGMYHVVMEYGKGATAETVSSKAVDISAGDTNVYGLNFTLGAARKR